MTVSGTAKGDIEKMYPAYALLSHDTAHASITALKRHFPHGHNGHLTMAIAPPFKPSERLATLDMECDAVLGCCIGVSQLLNGTSQVTASASYGSGSSVDMPRRNSEHTPALDYYRTGGQSMTNLSATSLGAEWLARFTDEDERATAAALINEILLVDRNALVRGLRSLVESILHNREDVERPIALFAERAVPKSNSMVLSFFPNTKSGRATGLGIAPITVNPNDQEVGSEGLIGNLITNLVRHYGADLLSHPGPDRMRRDRIGHIVILTDFIGSGKRVWEMLEAFRAVATLRSWRSYHLLSFNVVAYSATEEGLRLVGSSRLKPKVSTVTGCPTLWNTFSGAQLSSVLALCRRYPPRHRCPTGFSNGGTLIAFAHGVPNNAPPILYSGTRGWTGLFRRRSTAGAEMSFPADAMETVADRATRLLRIRNAHKYLADPAGERWITTLMVLATLSARVRSVAGISARSGLPLSQVEAILSYTRIARWTSKQNGLTPLGRQELARLRRRRRRAPILPKAGSSFYYPTQLRAR
jgi:hypothetical protein